MALTAARVSSVEYSDGLARLCRGRRALDERRVEELERLYELATGFDLDADSFLYVALFQDVIWVVPALTRGWPQLLKEHWAADLNRRSLFFRAELDTVPLRWRPKVLGVLPLMPKAVLGVHPRSTLPVIEEEGPVQIGSDTWIL